MSRIERALLQKKEHEEFQEEWKQKSEERYFAFIEGVEKILGFYPTKVTRVIKAEAATFLRGSRLGILGLSNKQK